MALFTPSASPAVSVKEIDLTGVVPNVQTSTGAFVGNFGWGPASQTTLVSDENGLVSTFGAPSDSDGSQTLDFHSAAYFLRYSNSLYVVREVDSDAKNALANHSSLSTLTAKQIKNLDDFENTNLDSGDGVFLAKYPGKIGSSLLVSMVGTGDDSASDQDNAFNGWAYKSHFDGPTGTSAYAASHDASNDEVHIVVVDEDGGISGTAGTVLETFPFLSVATDAKNADGTSNYYKDVLKTQSQWIYAGVAHTAAGDSDAIADFGGNSANNWNTATTKGTAKDFKSNQVFSATESTWSFHSGASTNSLTSGEIQTGFTKFNDVDNIEIDFLIPPLLANKTDATAVVNDLVAIAEIRKDCVVCSSPDQTAVVTTGTNTAILETTNSYTKSSYLVQDNNFLKIYDKYNDKYIKIPANSSTAGLMAATDLVAAPWFSPAGARRGRYLGITDIVVSPTKAERDALYKAGVNPIANIPGEGVMLYGDKTNLARPSAFDRINVRRLFLAIERAIGIAGRNVMFEFNDEFTRAEFTNIVEPFLREIQGRRGITDFKVVCDTTNNTPAVIDRNEFIASIFIKPARSINYVTLNFVAVRTGVEFEEVIGTV